LGARKRLPAVLNLILALVLVRRPRTRKTGRLPPRTRTTTSASTKLASIRGVQTRIVT